MLPKIEITKFLGADNTSYIERCKQCGEVNRVKFRVCLWENQLQTIEDIRYLCIKCLVSLSYNFLNVKRSTLGGE